VATYFDFGGGVAGNTKTFPKRLKTFCFCLDPPIILSHWDHDHWSSEGRDTRVHSSTWIVPRQTMKQSKRAPHHAALITSIQSNGGAVLIWPNQLSTKLVEQIRINRCTGVSKNSSGLAIEAFPPPGISGKPVLLPADAGYADLPTYPAQGAHDAIVCPHHGGSSNSPTVPSPPARKYQRLIYSYGKSVGP
jgi:hypothetical protein